MTYECFAVEVSDRVAHVRMKRPDKLNSMIASFWRELPQIADELFASGSVRAMVFSAEGRHFSAGMDLSEFGLGGAVAAGVKVPRSRTSERLHSLALRFQDSFNSLERSRIPVIMAIHGACVGGAVDMVCAADMRYATEDAYFSIAEIDLGITADVGTLQRMPKLVAEGIVRELAYTGRRWTAAEAHAAGFVNRLYSDHGSLVEGVLGIATEIASKSPMAVRGTKAVLGFTRDHSVADSLEYVATWNAAHFEAHDMAEIFAARSEGRSPEFADLLAVDAA